MMIIEGNILRQFLEGLKGYILLLMNGSRPEQLALPTVQRVMPGLFSCGCLHPSSAHGLVCGTVVCLMCPPKGEKLYYAKVSRMVIGSHT